MGSSILSVAEAAKLALAACDGGEPVALVTVVGPPEMDLLGRKLAVTANAATGTLGSRQLDERARLLAREALESRESRTVSLELAGVAWQLYVEPLHPRPELVIVGAGHIARPLCAIGAMLDFRVSVLDDRPEYASEEFFPAASRLLLVDWENPFEKVSVGPDTYVVLVTRGHKYDYDCIHQLLKMDARPAYVGMIGSRRRVTAAFEALVSDGVDPARLEDLRAPIGLNIGAESPEEIAVAIAAEIVRTRRGGDEVGLAEQEKVLGRVARRHEALQKGG